MIRHCFHFEYQPPGHFRVQVNETDRSITFHFDYEPFENPKNMTFDDWNKRTRINQLLVEPEFRYQGHGKALKRHAEKVARNDGTRAIILETQICNLPAISFYQSYGYQMIGCDIMCYSNQDIERAEVRQEMGKSFDKQRRKLWTFMS